MHIKCNVITVSTLEALTGALRSEVQLDPTMWNEVGFCRKPEELAAPSLTQPLRMYAVLFHGKSVWPSAEMRTVPRFREACTLLKVVFVRVMLSKKSFVPSIGLHDIASGASSGAPIPRSHVDFTPYPASEHDALLEHCAHSTPSHPGGHAHSMLPSVICIVELKSSLVYDHARTPPLRQCKSHFGLNVVTASTGA